MNSKLLVNYLKQSIILNHVLKRTFLTAPFPELSKFPKSINSHESLYKFSIENPELFWGTIAQNRLVWDKKFDQVTTGSFSDPDFNLKWFINGKLNVSVNCVDRHYLKNPKKTALIWEKDEPGTEEYVTYEELYNLMNQFANMLKSYGIKKGDRVAIYMPTCPLTVVAMLACARIGAVHSVVFAGFSAESLASRINDSQCTAVITGNQSLRANKPVELKKTVDAAVEMCPSVKNVFIAKITNSDLKLGPKDVLIDNVIYKQSTICDPEIMDSEDPLFMLYTSGSTGKPKGLVHTQAGYLIYAALTHQLVFNYDSNDVFGCLADVGWITGHTYVVYAPLCNGGTTVLFESTPIYPNPGRYWETVQRLRINQLYVAPTSLRLLIKYGEDWVYRYNRSSLKCLGSVGEPINHEAWYWYRDLVGEKRCPVVDTWWQTETGGQCITPHPSDKNAEIKPAIAMRPFFGINPILLDEKGNELNKHDAKGILAIKQPWPGMARTIYGDHKRYLETYIKPFPGYYFTGDGAITDHQGHFQITGRVDDVINVSGHRIGTAEVEDALDEHPAVAESAVVGFPHGLLGEGIYAFVILKREISMSNTEITRELNSLVRKKISGYAVPHHILVTSNLPKTRSGKIMRRILRKIAADNQDDLGDITTLSDPSVVSDILKLHNELKSKSKE